MRPTKVLALLAAVSLLVVGAILLLGGSAGTRSHGIGRLLEGQRNMGRTDDRSDSLLAQAAMDVGQRLLERTNPRNSHAELALQDVMQQLELQRAALQEEQEKLKQVQARRSEEEARVAHARETVAELDRKARQQAASQEKVLIEQAKVLQNIDSESQKRRQEEEKAKEDASFKKFWFNEYRSSLLPLNRSIPDTRVQECRDLTWDLAKLTRMSVIICFVDEAWSALLRTVWSVVNRTPRSLLTEILLVDDGSSADWLGPHLQVYIDKHWAGLVRVIRSDARLGLIRARLLGAKHAKGPVLTFLDSHCECNLNWAEPILDIIRKDKSSVVTPVIDTIEAKTMNHVGWVQRVPAVGTFSWTLDFTWKSGVLKPGQAVTDPVDSPTMAGGLFSIDKSYWEHIGTYDEEMDGWGGENLEISFRIWQCGGTLVTAPCSHVGHIFRDSHPYTVPGSTIHDTFTKNSARLAEVWMDEYKEYFYNVRPHGDLSKRKVLRHALNCRPFKWYMETLLPTMFIPDKAHIKYSGAVRNSDGQCLDKMGSRRGGKAGVYFCHGQGSNQAFMYSITNEIRTTDDLCLDAWATQFPGDVHLESCHGSRGNQEWHYDANQQTIVHAPTRKCLESHVGPGGHKALKINVCSDSANQKWSWQ